MTDYYPRSRHAFTPQEIREFWQQAFCAAMSGYLASQYTQPPSTKC